MSNFNIPAKLLVIALSGRMPAQLAVDAGYAVFVIDCYADLDTRQLALESIKGESLRLADIQPALEYMRHAHALTHVLYGSGFENCAESLAYLEQHLAVLGNPFTVFRQFQNKQAFFRQLAVFSIPYPETVFTAPVTGGAGCLNPCEGRAAASSEHITPSLI